MTLEGAVYHPPAGAGQSGDRRVGREGTTDAGGDRREDAPTIAEKGAHDMVRLGLWLLLASAGTAGAAAPPGPAGGASSSAASPNAAPAPAARTLDCSDFRRQPDGSWTPRRPVVVGGMTVTPAMSFSRGVSFGGVDAAATLDAHCLRRRGE